jgi:hypothetical protein
MLSMRNSASSTTASFDSQRWAIEQFGRCKLGDVRRTKRLIDYAARQVQDPQGSTYRACQGDGAAVEGAYGLLENDEVLPEAIEEGVFRAAADAAAKCELVLAVQDTTSVTYPHSVAEEFGDVGSVGPHKSQGLWVHSTLMVDADRADPLGLIDQSRWIRERNRSGKATRNQRPYEDKESFKWQQAAEQMTERLHRTDNVVTVADREADVFEFMQYQLEHELRFVVRAFQNRPLETKDKCSLWPWMVKQPVRAKRTVEIQQRGAQRSTNQQNERAARAARQAVVTIRAAQVTLRPPQKMREGKPLCVHAVLVQESHCPKGHKPIEWMLLTTEAVDTVDAMDRVSRYYEQRWLVEEFHKAWKTGCRLEQRRLQSAGNLERLMVILAPMAVQMLRLRALTQLKPSTPCDIVLSTAHWRCLHATVLPKKRRLRKAPRLDWALEAIGNLGGWCKTKRNPRPGWLSLWRGWLDLERYVQGWLAHAES